MDLKSRKVLPPAFPLPEMMQASPALASTGDCICEAVQGPATCLATVSHALNQAPVSGTTFAGTCM